MKKIYQNIFNHPIKATWIIVIIATLFLTTAFSTFSNDLILDGLSAVVRVQKDIRVNGVSLSNTESDAISNWEDYNIRSISAGISLPNSDSTITYAVKIINTGNVEASISEITGLPSNLTYTINNYNLRDMLCDDQDANLCKLGSISTIYITIGYAENGYDSESTDSTIKMNFMFTYMVDAVAKIGDSYYDTLQEAVDAVPTDNTETTVILLKNTTESITVVANKNIVFDFGNNTLSITENKPVISNYGTLKISNGTISSTASANGAINNESTGIINFTGGRVITTGGKQALYNNKGTVTISGNTYFSATTTARAAVQNVSGGKMTITGGTIVSTGTHALSNAGSLTIGIKDGNINSENPVFQGKGNGVYSSSNFKFYDGIVKSEVDPFSDLSKITDKEPDYGIVNSTEEINGKTYNTAHLGISETITFNPRGGTVSETVRYVEAGHRIGNLPTPTRSGYIFDGWFTGATDGEQIHANTIVTATTTYYAHWTKTSEVAQIGSTKYDTLKEAIDAVPLDTPTTITILKDISETLTIVAGKNIELDLNGKTISNSGNNIIIENSGSLSIYGGGGFTTNSGTHAAINNTGGYLEVANCEIRGAAKQAIYSNLGGTVIVKDGAYLTSQVDGKTTDTTMERGTLQNDEGTLIITGGTIIGEKQHAVSNRDILIIGTKDGSIDTSKPVLRGASLGIKSIGTIEFYDGIIKGKNGTIDGTVSTIEDNSEITNDSETISGSSYQTAYLTSTN